MVRTTSSSALEVMVAREEGNKGGRVCEEDGSRSGVEVVEFRADCGRTRFARRKVKNAVGEWISNRTAVRTRGLELATNMYRKPSRNASV